MALGVSLDLDTYDLWESIKRYLSKVEYNEYYFGSAYLCAGKQASK